MWGLFGGVFIGVGGFSDIDRKNLNLNPQIASLPIKVGGGFW